MLGLFVSGHPLEEFADAIQVHTHGTLAKIVEDATSGRLRDRNEVTLGAMVSTVAFTSFGSVKMTWCERPRARSSVCPLRSAR